MSCSSSAELRFSRSSRFGAPATAMMESRSATAAMWPVFLPMDSHSCAATACRSPIGEYFLKIPSPSFSV